MATETEYTYLEVSENDSKEKLWVVIDNKVYDVSKFVDEHPGGEEVMIDVGGQDGTEAFEDVGHSDEAREILAQYLIGKLKRTENDPKPSASHSTSKSSSSGEPSSGGIPGFVYAIAVALVAAGGYYYLQQQQQQSQ